MRHLFYFSRVSLALFIVFVFTFTIGKSEGRPHQVDIPEQSGSVWKHFDPSWVEGLGLGEEGENRWMNNPGVQRARELYGWSEYTDLWHSQISGSSSGESISKEGSRPAGKEESRGNIIQTGARLSKPLAQAQEALGKPVYVTLTTIHNRLYGIAATIETLLQGDMLPSHIYIFLSEGPFLLDQGVSRDYLLGSAMSKLRALYRIFPHISVVFVDNIGPHRKLLPLLAKKWAEDCVIVTVDDHLLYPPSMLASLVQ